MLGRHLRRDLLFDAATLSDRLTGESAGAALAGDARMLSCAKVPLLQLNVFIVIWCVVVISSFFTGKRIPSSVHLTGQATISGESRGGCEGPVWCWYFVLKRQQPDVTCCVRREAGIGQLLPREDPGRHPSARV